MYAPGAPSGDSSRTGGESLAIVSRCRTKVRSSICAPFKLIDPWSDGVWIRTRGLAPSTAARLCNAFGPVAVGWAWGCGKGCALPLTTLVLGGLAVGKYLFAAQLQPSSTSALSNTARIRFLLSFNASILLRYRVVALTAPRMAAEDAFQGQPAAPRGPIASNRGDRIGRAARLVAARRRKDLRWPQLPAARNPDEQAGDHWRSLSSAPTSSERNRPKSRSMPLARPIST